MSSCKWFNKKTALILSTVFCFTQHHPLNSDQAVYIAGNGGGVDPPPEEESLLSMLVWAATGLSAT